MNHIERIEHLSAENERLRNELINLFSVVESGDWSFDCKSENRFGFMSVPFAEAEEACDRAEKLISETGK